jgi:hypothetical protein
MLGAVMDFQSKLKALTETDYFVRGVMVFPNAYVNANYGSTRQIHCLRNERLIDYLRHQTPRARVRARYAFQSVSSAATTHWTKVP